MSAPSNSRSSAQGDKTGKAVKYNVFNHYMLSPHLESLASKGLTQTEWDKFYENQQKFLKDAGKCMNAAQTALLAPFKLYTEYQVSAQGSISCLKSLNKHMQGFWDLGTEKNKGSVALVNQICGLVKKHNVFHANVQKEREEVDIEALKSLMAKLRTLSTLKKGDTYPDIQITDEDVSNVAKSLKLGAVMLHEIPEPVSASEDELDKLAKGFESIVRLTANVEKKETKFLYSPGELYQFYGASESAPSLDAKCAYMQALRDLGITDDEIKKMTGLTTLPTLEGKKRAASADDSSPAASGGSKKMRASAVAGPPSLPTAAAPAAAAPDAAAPDAAAPDAAAPAAAAPAAAAPAAAAPAIVTRRRNLASMQDALDNLSFQNAAGSPADGKKAGK